MLSAEETTAVQTFLTKQNPKDAKLVMGKPRRPTGGVERPRGAAARGAKAGSHGEKVGDRLEVSGESILLVKEVAERIAADG